ncbi:Fc.00g065330.m01.CDS01 [Cosmosporella sp. VM-42]
MTSGHSAAAEVAANGWSEAGQAEAAYADAAGDVAAAAFSTGVDVGELHQRDQEHGQGGMGIGSDAPGSSSSSSSSSSSEISTDSLLKFADIPSYASQLSHLPSTPGSTDPSRNINSNPDNFSSNASDSQSSYFPANDSCTITTATSLPVAPPPPPSAPHLATSALRKTSPGLAARLKALGFGSSKPSAQPSTPQHDHIGRLDEDQIRQLDEKHRAASIRSAISRRGRPWKGVSATPSPKAAAASDPDQTLPPIVVEDSPPNPTLLPEIRTPEPLDMDTHKYRLPDHTNGNGTKVTLDTRREHIQRTLSYPSPDEVPPPPPPKDTPKDTPTTSTPSTTTPPNDFVSGLNSYFTPGHTRPGSIYTLSRASFANQLAQLTALQLPDAGSLSNQVAAIPTAHVAVKALINAADQIRSWISKATEVIGGLDSEDDVEWAAAGGREGLAEVESAITRFEELINAYVGAIEQLQSREDISNVSTDDLTRAVSQMEAIIEEWAKIRRILQVVRGQVEIAMEWEELWNNVLGDIQGEMDELSRLVFEMEERRHKSLMAAASGEGVDIGDLETIVEDNPPQRLQAGSRFSLPVFPVSPSSPSTPGLSLDDSSLLALFARMQPLRASLDFLPMRLSVFEARASKSFPTACDELDMRCDGLDASYKKLEKDAESLRKELGEDRWVIVFRGAGRQAQKMHESVERSLLKLKEAIEAGLHLTNQAAMAKRIESYEAKKTHYGPAIERVLSIIDKGVRDRLTVNGEVLRLHAEMQSRWETLKDQIRDIDAMLEEIHNDKGQQLRDSISSMLSNDRSTIGSGRETPGSSPPSSVIMSSLGLEPHTPTSHKKPKMRSSSVNSGLAHPPNRRHSSLPAPTGHSHLGRKPGFSRLSSVAASSGSNSPPIHPSQIKRPGSTLTNRPRWNGSTNPVNVDTGHNFKPLTLTTPSPYAKRTPTQRSTSSITPGSSSSKLPMRSPLARASSESPRVDDTPTKAGYSRLSFRERLAEPGPYSQQALAKPRLSTKSSMTHLNSGRRSSLHTPKSTTPGTDENRPGRPASSLASSSRRTSLLPQTKGRAGSDAGRASPQALAGARMAMRKSNGSVDPKDNKPRWRH